MGSNSSKYGNIHIRSNKAFYIAGETVQGNIYLNITNKFPSNTVILKIKGYEKCHAKSQKNKNDGRIIFFWHKI